MVTLRREQRGSLPPQPNWLLFGEGRILDWQSASPLFFESEIGFGARVKSGFLKYPYPKGDDKVGRFNLAFQISIFVEVLLMAIAKSESKPVIDFFWISTRCAWM